MKPIAVYLHTPFCPTKCGYCDFNSYAMDGDIVPRTVEAIGEDIARSPWRGRPAKTIFFGGGTPTFLAADQLEFLLDRVREAHPPVEGCEITSEANPGTVDQAKFGAMVQAGFNRVSLGAQSFVPEDLIRLGRVHSSGDVGAAVSAARRAGFENLNLDLMFALPGQNLARWKQNLEFALALKPDHLSLYGLTIEYNTRFNRLNRRGMLDLPTDEVQVEMYEAAMDLCDAAGLEHYEISNFARPGRECQHNLCYWRNEEYAAYGPGAVGFVDGTRFTNLKHPERYCEAIDARQALWCESEQVTPELVQIERVMMGLRLEEGVEISESDTLASLLASGWMERVGEKVRLTRVGKSFHSEIVTRLI